MLKPDGNQVDRQEANSEELALLAKVRLGDRKAFSELYADYHRRLYTFIQRFLNDAAIAEEVLDDVMLVVWRDCRKFRGDSRLSTWIFGIAFRKVQNALRKEQRYQDPLNRTADPVMLAGNNVTYDNWLAKALQRLSVEHRQVIVLTYYDGFSYKEIARIANCPVNTVKTRMFHARRNLKSVLQELGEPCGSSR